ncbi:KilA-N domain-containing protein [Xanthobacter sp. VTT E-85241]|uniref:KilA-N domain-containing protein n=1 Tax=Roseixanthobacter finlandensis TaxID=3119922 RepID=UPI0037299D0A
MSKDVLSKIRNNDVYKSLHRVLLEYGVERHEVEDRRPHPCLRFEYAGKERKVMFAGTPSSRRSPTISAANLRRELRAWGSEAAAPVAEPAPFVSDDIGHIAMPRPSALSYQGRAIQAEDDRLCLTDMWRAAGSDMSKRPVEWLRSKAARDFIEHLETMVGNSHLLQTDQGRGGTTFAHWQIGIAYAKYLSPEFHVWCNTIVRGYMEGKPAPLPDSEMIQRMNGMIKMLARKVTEIERAVPLMIGHEVEQAIASDPRRAVLDYVSVRELLDDAKAIQKGRRGVNVKIGFELRSRAAVSNPPVSLRRCPHSNVWLFPRDFAAAYMDSRGAALVSGHNATACGQGVIDFGAARRATHKSS